VAVADNPAGPLRDVLGKPLVSADTFPGRMIDPAAFTDDGVTCLYWGGRRRSTACGPPQTA
jgi:large repetitive protein